MIIVELIGGLGNQMFQYAFKLSYAHKNNIQVKINAHKFEAYAAIDTLRKLEIDNFNIDNAFASKDEVRQCLGGNTSYLRQFIRKVVRKIFKKELNITNEIFEKNGFETCFDQNLLKYRENAYFRGYYQNEKYFIDVRNEVLKAFSLKNSLNEQNIKMLENIKSAESISVHVRRGDYVNLQHIHGLCTLAYYNNAIEHMGKNVKNPHFFLFSDDIEWVSKNLKIHYPYTLVNINSADAGCFDLELMKNCKHNIVANSSFSWWGAWLNENPDKIVIAPSTWFVSDELPIQEIVPPSWVKMSAF